MNIKTFKLKKNSQPNEKLELVLKNFIKNHFIKTENIGRDIIDYIFECESSSKSFDISNESNFAFPDNCKYYNLNNIKDFDMKKLKNTVVFQTNAIGSSGRGGFIYVILKDGEELLFDYFSSFKKGDTFHFEKTPIWSMVKEYLPIDDHSLFLNDKWLVFYRKRGCFVYLKKNYLDIFKKIHEQIK